MAHEKGYPEEKRSKELSVKLTNKALVTTALLVSMSVVIGQLSMIFANHTFRIGMARIPIVIASMMFGPIAGAMAGFLQDIIGVIVLGSWFHPGFALSAILVGVIPGAVVWLTRKKNASSPVFTLKNLIMIMALIFFLVNITLDTYWASTFLGDAYLVLVPLRATIYGGVAIITVGVVLSLSKVLEELRKQL